MKEEKFPKSRKPSHRRDCGEFWNLRGQHNQKRAGWEPQNMCLTSTASREVGQMLARVHHQGVGGWAGRHGLHNQCLG